MKPVKVIVIALAVYVGIVVAFESLIGVIQPAAGEVLVITTHDSDGTAHDRVLAHLQSDGKLYVAANHWPRAWYNRALENPEVEVAIDGEQTEHVAVPGFPPRLILRLDSR